MVKLLGADKTPSTFDTFKTMKYNNPDDFKELLQELTAVKQEQWARAVVDENSKINGYKVFGTADDIPQWAVDQANNWTAAEQAALEYYTSHEYSSINSVLRGGTTASSYIQEKIDLITSAIGNADIAENMVAWRGTRLSGFLQSDWLKANPSTPGWATSSATWLFPRRRC
jgi:hypothetical protein